MTARLRYPHKVNDHGQRINRLDWREMDGLVGGAEVTSGQPGAYVSRSSAGTNLHYSDPAMPWWGFLRSINGDVLIVSHATRAPGGRWWMESHVERVLPAPNYTVDHFEFFVIDPEANLGDPSETDRAVLVIGGFAVPDFRMLLVEPVDVEQLCEPCGDDDA